MEDKRNLHLQVQEMIDCYATNDPLKVMSQIPDDQDQEQSAVKWLATAALHGITAGASKISLRVEPDGSVAVTAKYKRSSLPSPGKELGPKIIKDMQEILHMESGKMPLSLGVRNDSVDLRVKLSSKEGAQKLSLKFPE
jgi:hypothetical protein